MREITDDALQRLYWACRRGSGFPGHLPHESNGIVTTTDILNGLGLINSEFDEFELLEEIERTIYASNNADQLQLPFQAIRPRDHEEFDDNQSVVSSRSTFGSPQLSKEHVPTTNSQRSTSELATSTKEIDMKEQFLAYSPDSKSLQSDNKKKISEKDEQQSVFHQAEDAVEPFHKDVNAFLDMSLFTPPSAGLRPSYNKYQLMPVSRAPVTTPQFSHVQTHQSPPALLFDCYLSPWQGSLAAAYQSVAI